MARTRPTPRGAGLAKCNVQRAAPRRVALAAQQDASRRGGGLGERQRRLRRQPQAVRAAQRLHEASSTIHSTNSPNDRPA